MCLLHRERGVTYLLLIFSTTKGYVCDNLSEWSIHLKEEWETCAIHEKDENIRLCLCFCLCLCRLWQEQGKRERKVVFCPFCLRFSMGDALHMQLKRVLSFI